MSEEGEGEGMIVFIVLFFLWVLGEGSGGWIMDNRLRIMSYY